MIQGLFVIEDTSINFNQVDSNKALFIVTDLITGRHDTIVTDLSDTHHVLIVAMLGDDAPKESLIVAEKVQNLAKNVRFIP